MPGANIQRVVRVIVGVLLLVSSPAAMSADEVVLENGRSFKDVIATEKGDTVEIEFAFGRMTVSADDVRAILEGSGPLAEYLSERDRLRDSPTSTASDWLSLANWAQAKELAHGFRECALIAANLDPEFDGLQSAMRTLDYVFEPELVRWIPYEVQMQRRGYVKEGSDWLSPAVQATRADIARQDADAAAQRDRDRLTDAVLVLAASQLAQPPPPQVVAYPVLMPAVVGPWAYHRPGRPAPYRPTHVGTGTSIGDIHRGRIPGSFLPIQSHSSGSFKVYASGSLSISGRN